MLHPFLLVCDVDGTLLGDDASLARFTAWLSPRRDQLRLAFASGRFFDSIHQSVRSTPLPQPDFVIGGVGTEVCDYRAGVRLSDWPGHQATERWSGHRLRHALAGVGDLVEQPAEFQSFWKVSYYLHDATADRLAEIEAKLAAADIDADVVYSSQRDLDVLPRGVNKGSAVAHLANQLAVPPDRVIVCGDTGNDLAMFRHGFRGVVVGNAMPELRHGAGEAAYRAARPFAAGVHEGVLHWLERAEALALSA